MYIGYSWSLTSLFITWAHNSNFTTHFLSFVSLNFFLLLDDFKWLAIPPVCCARIFHHHWIFLNGSFFLFLFHIILNFPLLLPQKMAERTVVLTQSCYFFKFLDKSFPSVFCYVHNTTWKTCGPRIPFHQWINTKFLKYWIIFLTLRDLGNHMVKTRTIEISLRQYVKGLLF